MKIVRPGYLKRYYQIQLRSIDFVSLRDPCLVNVQIKNQNISAEKLVKIQVCLND